MFRLVICSLRVSCSRRSLIRLTITLATDMAKLQEIFKLCGISAIVVLTAIATYSAIMPATTPVAFAAKPNNQACLGNDFSGYAQGGSLFGDFISFLAMFTRGVGNEIQAHLAGLVPDSTIPNSCNN